MERTFTASTHEDREMLLGLIEEEQLGSLAYDDNDNEYELEITVRRFAMKRSEAA